MQISYYKSSGYVYNIRKKTKTWRSEECVDVRERVQAKYDDSDETFNTVNKLVWQAVLPHWMTTIIFTTNVSIFVCSQSVLCLSKDFKRSKCLYSCI